MNKCVYGYWWTQDSHGISVLEESYVSLSLGIFFREVDFPGSSASKESAYNTADLGVPCLGRDDPLEMEMATHSNYSCLKNPMDRGAWWATVHGVVKSRTWLSNLHSLRELATQWRSQQLLEGGFGFLTTVKVLVAQSCPTLGDPMGCSLPRSSFQGKNTGKGCHFLLQGILPTQRLNLGLLKRRQTLYHLSHQGGPAVRWCPS